MATCKVGKHGRLGRRGLPQVEKVLLNRRKELLTQLELQGRLRERLRKESSDELDAVAELSETELTLSVAEIRSSEVAGIEDALRKIVEGTYGVCESCGMPIPAARLRAAPYATLCLACQKQSEGNAEDDGAALPWDRIEGGGMDEAAAAAVVRSYRESAG